MLTVDSGASVQLATQRIVNHSAAEQCVTLSQIVSLPTAEVVIRDVCRSWNLRRRQGGMPVQKSPSPTLDRSGR